MGRNPTPRFDNLEHNITEALIEQRCIGHGEGQEHTIADVNAGLIDDLIQPRLKALKDQLVTVTAERDTAQLEAVRDAAETYKIVVGERDKALNERDTAQADSAHYYKRLCEVARILETRPGQTSTERAIEVIRQLAAARRDEAALRGLLERMCDAWCSQAAMGVDRDDPLLVAVRAALRGSETP